MTCGTKIIIKKPNHTHVAADITDFDHAVTNILDHNGFVYLSGGIMTGGLSSPSLSCDTLYVGSNTIFFINSAQEVVNYLNSNDVTIFRNLSSNTIDLSAPPPLGWEVDGNTIGVPNKVAATDILILNTSAYNGGDLQGKIDFQSRYWSGDESTNGSSIKSFKAVPDGNAGTDLTFSTVDGGNNLNEHVRINSSGNIGIGTSNPDAKLTVAGDIKADRNILGTANNGLITFGYNHSNVAGVYGGFDGNSIQGAYFQLFGKDSPGTGNTPPGGGEFIINSINGPTKFTLGVFDGSSFGTKFVVNSDGNVGIGYNDPTEKLMVAGNVIIDGIIQASNLNVSAWNNVYSIVQANSAVNWNYQGTDIKSLTANWQNTYNSYRTTSALSLTGIVGTSNQILVNGNTISLPSNVHIAQTMFVGGTNGIQFGDNDIGGPIKGFIAPVADGIFRFGDSTGGGSPSLLLGSNGANVGSRLKAYNTGIQVRNGDDTTFSNLTSNQLYIGSRGTRISDSDNGHLLIYDGNNTAKIWSRQGTNTIQVPTTLYVGGNLPDETQAVALTRISSNTLSVQDGANSINPANLRIENTLTSETNRESLSLGWLNNNAQIGTAKGSISGVARNLMLLTDNNPRLILSATGNILLSSYNLRTTPSIDFNLLNDAPASSATSQISPAITWTGNGWKTNSVAGTQPVQFRVYTSPVQGTTAPTGKWLLQQNINNSGWTDSMDVNSNGRLTLYANSPVTNPLPSTLGFALQSDNSGSLRFLSTYSSGYLQLGGNGIMLWVAAGHQFSANSGGTGVLLGANSLGSGLCRIDCDNDNILATRNGTTAQAQRLYNTFTSLTNYERFAIDWQSNSNICRIGTQKGSAGGTARDLQLITDDTVRLVLSATGNILLSSSNLGTTPSIDLNLANNTLATVGAQQVSPAITWTGNGWKTNSVASSIPVQYRAYVLPVQGANFPTGKWVLQQNLNSAGFFDTISVSRATSASNTVIYFPGNGPTSTITGGAGDSFAFSSGFVSTLCMALGNSPSCLFDRFGGGLKLGNGGDASTAIMRNFDSSVVQAWLYPTTNNALSLQNGTAANTFYVHNTYGSTTNYERFAIDWQSNSNICRIGTQKGSISGLARDLQLITNDTTRITVSSTGETLFFNSLSSNNVIYSNTSNSNVWTDTTTTVRSNSALWGTGGGSGTGLTFFKEFSSGNTPNATTTVVGVSARGLADNIDMVLLPKGRGALITQIPDNTVVGGDKRGLNAIDFQRERSDRSRVASGDRSVLLGGINNCATGYCAAVLAGESNTNSNGFIGSIINGSTSTISDNSFGLIGNGFNHNITNYNYGTILNGLTNTVNAVYGTICGGAYNNITGNNGLIGNGEHNVINDSYSTILNGSYNQMVGSNSSILGGYNNQIANGCGYSTVLDGFGNSITNGSYTTVFNSKGAIGDRWGMIAKTTYNFADTGDVQNVKLQLYTTSLSDSPTILTLDGVDYGSSSNKRIVPDGKVLNGILKIIGVNNLNNYTSVMRQLVIKNNNSTDTILQSSVIGTDVTDAGTVDLTTDGSGYFIIRVTGLNNANGITRWTASIDADEITPIIPTDQYAVYPDCSSTVGTSYNVYVSQGTPLTYGTTVYNDLNLSSPVSSTSFIYNTYTYTTDSNGQITGVDICSTLYGGYTDCTNTTPFDFYVAYTENPYTIGTRIYSDSALTIPVSSTQFTAGLSIIETDSDGYVISVQPC